MRSTTDVGTPRSRWIATGVTVVTLFATLGLPVGDGENEGSSAFVWANVLALVIGVVLAIPVRTRRVGVGVLLGVAITAVVAAVLTFILLLWIVNALEDG